MKPDYKSWMPKGMICGGFAVTLVFLILFILFGLTGIVGGTLKTVLFIVLLILTIISCAVSVWMILLYRVFPITANVRCPDRSSKASPLM